MRGIGDRLGSGHPFAGWFDDGEFELEVRLVDEVVRVRDSRTPSVVSELAVGSRDLRLLGTDREVLAESPGALEPFAAEAVSVRERTSTTTEVGGASVDAVEVTVSLRTLTLRAVIATESPVSASLAHGASTLLVPVELRPTGLPVRVEILRDGDPLLSVGLAGVDEGETERVDAAAWDRVTADRLLDLAVPSDPDPPDAGIPDGLASIAEPSGAPAPASATRMRTAALTGSYRPDAGWLVGQPYLEEIRTGINEMLDGVSRFGVDLRGGTIDWWETVAASIDESDPRLPLLQQAATFLVATSGLGQDLPQRVSRLASAVDIAAHLGEDLRDEYDRVLDGLRDGTITLSADDLPDTVAVFWLVWSQERRPPELIRWFALAAAVQAMGEGEDSDADADVDFETRLGEIAEGLWAELKRTGGQSRPDMPGAPIRVEVPESERRVSRKVSASDVSGEVDLPGWVDDLANVTVTAERLTSKLPEEKLSGLDFALETREDAPDVPVVAGTVSVDEVDVGFSYRSSPAFSVGSVAGWIASGGKLAAAVTAGGPGKLTMEGVDVPIRLDPTVEAGRVGYDLRTEEPTIDDTTVTLGNYNPASLPTTLAASVWLSTDEEFLAGVVDEVIEDVDFLDDTIQLPNAWPDSWRLREPPTAEPFGTDEMEIRPDAEGFVRGDEVARESYGTITVDRVGRDETTSYEVSAGPTASFDPAAIGNADAGVVFSRPYLEAWVMSRLGLLPEYYDGLLEPLLGDLGVELPPLEQQVKAGELDDLGDRLDVDPHPVGSKDAEDDDERRGRRVPGAGYCHPPSGPSQTRRRITRIQRSSPTFATPADGTHQYGLDVQLAHYFTFEDVHLDTRWVAEVTPERCFEVEDVPDPGGIGPAIEAATDERVRELLEDVVLGPGDLPGVDHGGGDGGGDGSGGEPDEPEPSEDVDEETLEELARGDEGETQPPVRTMSLTVPRPGGGDREVQIVCQPPQCEWRPATDKTVLERYLSATVTTRAKIRVGFSQFGPVGEAIGEDHPLNVLFGNARLVDRFRRGGIWAIENGGGPNAMLGWLPQLDLRADVSESWTDGIEGLEADVEIHDTGGPVDDVPTADVEQAVREFCRDDVFDWLRPLSTHNDRLPVTNTGSLLGDSLAAIVLGMLGRNALASADDPDLDRLTGLLELSGRTSADSGYGVPPDHVIDGDYVYIPVDLRQELTSIFTSPSD